ncbi:DUF2614 family zinc ribbon-containing protein [Shouchella lonarensis]|uniref:Zinc-ribbon containing domain-containing protein n=1 Tax=Shouchella lonarensis TaxID=1464122 RepID=A0A1G6GQD1_9BACI|nr:DUF2614 family zinc ribbon-containing protein [Shouchella lonarensis]SDB84043.1 Zinc-ribbon containing domain-containing protein [Shouchella lonarensis]
MKRNRSNKINKIRTFALGLVFIGILIMYIGIFFKENTVIMIISMSVGLLAVLSSTVVYFFIGLLSTKAVIVACPNCEKRTKLLGRADACMHCDQPLTMDKSLEGKPLDDFHK